MKNLIKTLFGITLILMLWSSYQLGWAHPPIQTNSTQPTPIDNFGGLDIVFLVDQSGSMSGCPSYVENDEAAIKKCEDQGYQHPRPNDPQELRKYSPRFVMDFLGTDALYFHPDAVHRMAVVNFGTKTKVDLDWTDIAPQSQEEWTPMVRSMKDELSAENLSFTNPKDALSEAGTMFGNLPNLNKGERKKVVILLTDGEPYLPPFEEWESKNLKPYKEEMATLLKTQFPTPEYTVCVVAMNDFDSNYWKYWEPYWASATDCVKKLAKNSDVPVVFTELLRSWIPKPPGGNGDWIDIGQTPIRPYLYLVVFTFFKSAEDVQVVINGPDNKPIPADQMLIERNGPIERVQIKRPQPGMWRTEVVQKQGQEQTEVKVYRETLAIQAQSSGNVSGQLYQYDPIDPTYTLIDQDGNVVVSYPNYPLQLKAALTQPDGANKSLDFTAQNEQLRLNTPIVAEQPGDYQLKIEGSSLDPADNSIIPIFSDEKSFNVAPVQLLNVAILTPTNQTELMVHTLEGSTWVSSTMEASWHIVKDTDKSVLAPSSATNKNPDQLFNLRLTNTKTSSEITTTIPIALSGSIFKAQLGVLPEGEYLLEVTLTRDDLKRDYNVREVTQQVTFIRTENPAYVNYLEELEYWEMVKFWGPVSGCSLMGLLLLAILAWWVIITRHPAIGELTVEGVSSMPSTFSLGGRNRNNFTLKHEDLKLNGIKAIQVLRAQGQDGVTLKITTLDGNSTERSLSTGNPIEYVMVDGQGTGVNVGWKV